MTNGGEVSGKNFLMKETFEYAKERVANRVENETSGLMFNCWQTSWLSSQRFNDLQGSVDF